MHITLELHILTLVVTIVHVILRSYVVLAWMHGKKRISVAWDIKE